MCIRDRVWWLSRRHCISVKSWRLQFGYFHPEKVFRFLIKLAVWCTGKPLELFWSSFFSYDSRGSRSRWKWSRIITSSWKWRLFLQKQGPCIFFYNSINLGFFLPSISLLVRWEIGSNTKSNGIILMSEVRISQPF